jgi:hypothetical protein
MDNIYEFEIHAPWTIGDNDDYDTEIWNLIFEEENIEDEDEPISTEEMIDAILEGFETEFDELTDEEYYNKYYGDKE